MRVAQFNLWGACPQRRGVRFADTCKNGGGPPSIAMAQGATHQAGRSSEVSLALLLPTSLSLAAAVSCSSVEDHVGPYLAGNDANCPQDVHRLQVEAEVIRFHRLQVQNILKEIARGRKRRWILSGGCSSSSQGSGCWRLLSLQSVTIGDMQSVTAERRGCAARLDEGRDG